MSHKGSVSQLVNLFLWSEFYSLGTLHQQRDSDAPGWNDASITPPFFTDLSTFWLQTHAFCQDSSHPIGVRADGVAVFTGSCHHHQSASDCPHWPEPLML